jgi:uncharacterized protein YbaP (TraB family)
MPIPQRRSIVRLSLALLLASLAAVAGYAQTPSRSFLWKVQSGSGVLYLAGSIHALPPDAYPLNAAYQRAFDEADTLVEEIDLGTASPMTAMPVLMSKGVYRDGRTFDTVLSKETVALVNEQLKSVPGMSDLLRPMKPWVLTLMLTALQLQKNGLNPAIGLDQHFFDQAAAANKRVVGLETLDQQLEMFDAMPDAAQEQMLRSTLEDLNSNENELAQVLAAWKSGDAAAVEKNVLGGFKTLPAAYDALIVQRNRAWMPQMDTCLARQRPCFVVVGAAHLVGPDGLLALLQKKGYRVQQQ